MNNHNLEIEEQCLKCGNWVKIEDIISEYEDTEEMCFNCLIEKKKKEE